MQQNTLLKALTISVFTLVFSLTASAQIPDFSFKTLSGEDFTNQQLAEGKSIFIMLFDPGCDHCQTQAQNIGQSADQFDNVHFVFVSMFDDKDGINQFRETYFGETDLDVTFLIDPSTGINFETYFGYTDDPVYIHLYKPSGGKYKYKFFGHEQTASELLKYL